MEKKKLNRLESLDVLRGFDLFCLVVLEMVLHPLAHAIDMPWFNSFMWGFSHVEWEGFSTWDLVMPLFLFMAGVSMPFSLSRYKDMPDKMAVYRRIGKRVLLLWVFGMMCQGNLLALDPDRVYLYSNTLQSIAMGYLIASLLFLHVRIRVQIGIAASLLLIFWGTMEFITVGNYGGGSYTPDSNLAEWIDRTVLGRFRDGATVENGEVIFATWYLWTSSMVLVSSGYCFLLMGLFYYWIDYKGHRKYTTWLKVYGMNSILAYMLTNVVSFRCIGESLFFGTQQYLGNYYPVLIAMCNVSVIYVLLYAFYKHNIFLKV